MTDTLTLAQFARRRGIDRRTAYRWLEAGLLGTVIAPPPGKKYGHRLSVAELTKRGLLQTGDQPTRSEWSVYAGDVMQVILRHAQQTFDPVKLTQFYTLWAELWGMHR